MATVKQKRISWTPANDADIVGHRVFVVEAGQPIDLNNFIEVPMPGHQIVAPDDFPAGTFSGDTNYEVSICSVDDVGNLSDLVTVSSPFDFIAPGAPTNLIVETI